MKITLTSLIILSSFLFSACKKRLTDKNMHEYTDGMVIPDALFKKNLLVHFIDSISPNAWIGSSSWDKGGLVLPSEILSPYVPEEIDESINNYGRRVNKAYNKLVPIANAQLLNEITQCKVKCVPFRKADFLNITSKKYPAEQYSFVLIRSIIYWVGPGFLYFQYSLFDRANNTIIKLPYKKVMNGLKPCIDNERFLFRKLSYEYLKRFPE